MPKPTFRNPDKYQVLPWREWLRENMPWGTEGFVCEDMDMIPLVFGSAIGRAYADDGRFMLVEVKQKAAPMTYAQKRVFGLVHRTLRKGDPLRKYYVGFYLLHWYDDYVKVNGIEFDSDQLKRFFEGKIPIESLFDDDMEQLEL